MLDAAVPRGHEIRIGLEDVLTLPDRRRAPDNAALVVEAVAALHADQRADAVVAVVQEHERVFAAAAWRRAACSASPSVANHAGTSAASRVQPPVDGVRKHVQLAA